MSTAEDELAIRSLVARYADAVTRRDEAVWAETWAKDATWELLGRRCEGRDEILGFWRTAITSLSFVAQFVYQGVVDVEGDRASGRFHVSEVGKTAAGDRTLLLALYHDAYRRAPEGWRFSRRSLQLLYHGPPDLSGRVFPVAVAPDP